MARDVHISCHKVFCVRCIRTESCCKVFSFVDSGCSVFAVPSWPLTSFCCPKVFSLSCPLISFGCPDVFILSCTLSALAAPRCSVWAVPYLFLLSQGVQFGLYLICSCCPKVFSLSCSLSALAVPRCLAWAVPYLFWLAQGVQFELPLDLFFQAQGVSFSCCLISVARGIHFILTFSCPKLFI